MISKFDEQFMQRGKTALQILFSYLREGKDNVWDDSDYVNRVIKRYLNSGFDDGFIKACIQEGEKILNAQPFPEERIKKEIDESLLSKCAKETKEYKEFMNSLLEQLKTQFKLLQERKDNYYYKNVLPINEETKKLYDSKYEELTNLSEHFSYGYNDRDNIRRLAFDKESTTISKLEMALENLLQEKPFPYEWLANSLERKKIDAKGNNIEEKYYNWVGKMLGHIKSLENNIIAN